MGPVLNESITPNSYEVFHKQLKTTVAAMLAFAAIGIILGTPVYGDFLAAKCISLTGLSLCLVRILHIYIKAVTPQAMGMKTNIAAISIALVGSVMILFAFNVLNSPYSIAALTLGAGSALGTMLYSVMKKRGHFKTINAKPKPSDESLNESFLKSQSKEEMSVLIKQITSKQQKRQLLVDVMRKDDVPALEILLESGINFNNGLLERALTYNSHSIVTFLLIKGVEPLRMSKGFNQGSEDWLYTKDLLLLQAHADTYSHWHLAILLCDLYRVKEDQFDLMVNNIKVFANTTDHSLLSAVFHLRNAAFLLNNHISVKALTNYIHTLNINDLTPKERAILTTRALTSQDLGMIGLLNPPIILPPMPTEADYKKALANIEFNANYNLSYLSLETQWHLIKLCVADFKNELAKKLFNANPNKEKLLDYAKQESNFLIYHFLTT